MPQGDHRYTRAWQLLRAKVYEVYGYTCHLCGQPIDPTLPPRTPMSKSVDHLDPVALHGNQLPPIHRLRPAHYGCNSRRGKGTRTDQPAPRYSRQW